MEKHNDFKNSDFANNSAYYGGAFYMNFTKRHE